MNDNYHLNRIIEDFISRHVQTLSYDEKEDLQQDIYVALLQTYGHASFQYEDANLIAEKVLANFKEERRARSLPQRHCSYDHDLVADLAAPNLDLKLDIEAALAKLPTILRNIAVDLFYNELTQKEVAIKYKKTQPWVAAAKKQLLNSLKETLCP